MFKLYKNAIHPPPQPSPAKKNMEGEGVKHNLLILGGTSEASELIKLISDRIDITATLSLAGRTKNPTLPQGINYRIGGFGGAQGLVNYIKENNITALICATHPFAAKMPFNAAEAAELTGIPLIHLLRPHWQKQAGDNRIEVTNHAQAAQYLSSVIRHPSSVFLAVGRLELTEYAGDTRHNYLIRSIDEITDKPLANATYITARPPFSFASELELLQKHKIDLIVSKNSGGSATYAKIAAARELGIPIIMIKRPPRPEGIYAESAGEALAKLTALASTP